MRRRVCILLALALALLGVFVPASSAYAAAPHAAAAGTCPTPPAYPPAPHATVQSSTTTPLAGQSIEVSGIRYCPNESVDITIAGKHVGTGHTNGQGSFDPAVIVPGPAGAKQLCGIGASGLSNDADCLTLNVGASTPGGGGSGGTGASGSGGGTAFTGVDVLLLVLVAAALLGAGVAINRGAKRRKQTEWYAS